MGARKSLNLVLWKNALPLWQGRVRFAPGDIRKRWHAAHDKFWLEDVQASLPSSQYSVADVQKALASAFDPRREADKAADEWASTQLRAGELVALGFEPPRKVSSEPVIIPAECWQAVASLGTDKLQVGGLSFIDIRVLPRVAAERIKAEWENETVPPHPAPKRGPRSSATDIAEAFEALLAAGRVNPDTSAKSHYPEIRAWLQYHRSGAGYSATRPSDETLRKTVQPMLAQISKK